MGAFDAFANRIERMPVESMPVTTAQAVPLLGEDVVTANRAVQIGPAHRGRRVVGVLG
ncbi:hypothetical protein [Yinghuangia sp. YIM S09857]|uniref:hypothetical protein n=1 Tax=Yinghuangia sp. YIM S09857 TaxID=3436929 RepID=UPI003F530455